MKSSVIVFPGSNCDRDIAVALEKFKIKNEMIWHDDVNLPKSDLVVLPGGFSYGDYLRTGCIASKSPIIEDIIKHAKKGGLIYNMALILQIRDYGFMQFCCHRVWEVSEGCVRNVLQVKCLMLANLTSKMS